MCLPGSSLSSELDSELEELLESESESLSQSGFDGRGPLDGRGRRDGLLGRGVLASLPLTEAPVVLTASVPLKDSTVLTSTVPLPDDCVVPKNSVAVEASGAVLTVPLPEGSTVCTPNVALLEKSEVVKNCVVPGASVELVGKSVMLTLWA